MHYRIVLAPKMSADLREHVLSDRTREQMAVTLCGINILKDEIRLLGRHLILMPPEAFHIQSAGYLELAPSVQRQILRLASDEGLSQIDWHSHPGESPHIGFSGTDNHHEAILARYLNERIPGTSYASVVMNRNALEARIWNIEGQQVASHPMSSIRWGDFDEVEVGSYKRRPTSSQAAADGMFSRQVLAFGQGLQERLRRLRVGVVGVGGIGGIVVEMLSRLGIQDWTLIDDDAVEMSNLNRLPGATPADAYNRTLKVNVARRNIARANPYARVRALPLPVSSPEALLKLKACDLVMVATDNHGSRLIVNRLAAQYLIPLVHLGVNIDVDEERNVTDISGAFAAPCLGSWCLQCAEIIDGQAAGWELADENLRRTLRDHGYVEDTPSPAVYHLNGLIASLAVAEIHNLIYPYKPTRRYLAYDGIKGELLPLEVESRNCPVCSPDGGIIGLGDLEPFPDYQRREINLPASDQWSGDPGDEEDDVNTAEQGDDNGHTISPG